MINSLQGTIPSSNEKVFVGYITPIESHNKQFVEIPKLEQSSLNRGSCPIKQSLIKFAKFARLKNEISSQNLSVDITFPKNGVHTVSSHVDQYSEIYNWTTRPIAMIMAKTLSFPAR